MADQQAPAQPEPGQASRTQPPLPAAKVGFGVTALVLGIVGLLLCWIPFFGLILPVLAVIFGGIGIHLNSGRGMAIAGLSIGIISVVINIVIMVAAASQAVPA